MSDPEPAVTNRRTDAYPGGSDAMGCRVAGKEVAMADVLDIAGSMRGERIFVTGGAGCRSRSCGRYYCT